MAYAFHILLFQPAFWKECELLTTKGGSITNSGQTMAVLKASHLPQLQGLNIVSPTWLTIPSSLRKITELMRQLDLQPSKAQPQLTHSRESLHFNPHPHLTLNEFCPIYTGSFIISPVSLC